MKGIRRIARLSWGRSHRARLRAKWDDAAFWFRLRYSDPGEVQRALNLVSRHTDRLGLRLRLANGVTQVYIGVSTATVADLLADMARDMGFRLTSAGRVPPPLTGHFGRAQHLSQGSPPEAGVDAYLVREQLFSLTGEARVENGEIFPEAITPNGHGSWLMPAPSLGIATRSDWLTPATPELLLENEEDWLIGQSPDGLMLGGRQVQILGAGDSTADWLSRLILTRLATKPTGLVVVDGRGDLMPRLLSKPRFARMRSAKQITYLDVSVAGQGGVNPLAAEPGEDLTQVQERWRWWFAGMGVVRGALDLLPKAIEAGVTDLVGLRRWLKNQKGNNFAAAASFRAILERLERNRMVHRWLTLYPVVLQAALKNGALLISCPHKGRWSRYQAIRGVLGLVTKPGNDLVLHHAQLAEADLNTTKSFRIVINASNPKPIPSINMTVLTRLGDQPSDEVIAALPSVSSRFELGHDSQPAVYTRAMLMEYGQCLQGGEALVVCGEHVSWCSLAQLGEVGNSLITDRR